MKARWLLLLVLLTAIIGFASGCGGGGGDDGDDSNGGSEAVPADAVAVVAGTSILKADFDRFFSQREKAAEAQGQEFPQPGTPEYADLQNQAVDFLVQRVEFAREAEALGIKVTDESVDQRLEELKNQFFEGDDAKYEAELTTLGLTDADVRADLRAQLISEQLFAEVTKDITVTADDVKTYYDENTDQFKSAESRDVAHILVETKKEADDIYQQLQDGADFETLAGKHSLDDASAENGGQLTDERGTFVHEFEEVAFALETGEIGQPVKSEFGWHVIKALKDTEQATTTSFDDAKQSIEEQLMEERQNTAMSEWVEQIRDKYAARVSYAVGFGPPPAAAAATTTP
jgi:parvulin-like peptidyl-prolyl isomerase